MLPNIHVQRLYCVAQLFGSYQCPWVRKVFGLSFSTLTDVLSVFATMTGAELLLKYPGPDMEMICECAPLCLCDLDARAKRLSQLLLQRRYGILSCYSMSCLSLRHLRHCSCTASQ